MIRVLVFEDHKGRQEALQLLLDHTPDMICVGIHSNCINVPQIIKEAIPDVVLMDIDMPEVNGIEGLRVIKKLMPGAKVIMQTVFEENDKIFAAVGAGADGYILKKIASQKLVEGIRDVMEGGAPMTPAVAIKLLEIYREQQAEKTSKFSLSNREMDILNMLAKGMSYKAIASSASISWNTVNSHVKNIYEKLDVHSVSQAVAKAIEQRLV